MVLLILDGNSEKAAHVRSNFCYLICLKHLIRPKAVTNRIACSPIFFRACAKSSELPSNTSAMLDDISESADFYVPLSSNTK